jgi:hypothetical protein
MTGLCIFGAGKAIMLAAAAFTLSWTHSVERTRWEEDWQVTQAGLKLVEARVQGSGAGMEPPPGARLENGWWAYAPELPAIPRLVLAASGATGEGWRVCAGRDCVEVGARPGGPVRLEACRPAGQARTESVIE